MVHFPSVALCVALRYSQFHRGCVRVNPTNVEIVVQVGEQSFGLPAPLGAGDFANPRRCGDDVCAVREILNRRVQEALVLEGPDVAQIEV